MKVLIFVLAALLAAYLIWGYGIREAAELSGNNAVNTADTVEMAR